MVLKDEASPETNELDAGRREVLRA